jgi:hypothetical protein
MPAGERVLRGRWCGCAAPKLLASGSPKVAILFLPRHLAQSRAPFTVVLAAFGQMARNPDASAQLRLTPHYTFVA